MYPALNKYNAPPSPPETHSSYFSSVPVHSAYHRAMATPGSSIDNGSFAPASMETPPSRFRRGSSIGYISTPGHSHREARDRTGSMASKFLVIVVPPSSVAQEHGNLGHTLSMGPGHRLSQGLIMPLFPTMYGQLTAIAREFNFPSSAGICLYYCFSEHGITMTPRLSDDIWPTIWGFADPTQTAAERRSPIAGKLEFDIDMTQARWYSAWLSSRHREPSEQYPPATAPNMQFRGERKFSFPPESEDDTSEQTTQQLHSAPVLTRHVPRKLSLIDRYDSAQPEARPFRSAHSPPTGLPLSSHVLSPITQQEEPQSARLNLNDRVKSWRASAIISSPVEMASTEPSAVEIVASPSEAATPASQSSFHMEDYAFSISSVGPDDRSTVGSYYQDYLPSVHMADRVNGSVCMTESYCTSAGPSDNEFFYNFEVDEDELVLTPDIAQCMFEEAPETPVTATSWGAPSLGSWSASSEIAYSPSLDLGFRTQFSAAPSAPSTATSWGPQSFDGIWSASSQRTTFSVHLGDRGEFTAPPTPQTATSWGAPSPGPFSPASPLRLPSPDVAHRHFDDSNEFEMRAAFAASWQPREPEEASSKPTELWAHSWPYRKAGVSLKTTAKTVSGFLKLAAPPKGKKAWTTSKDAASVSTYSHYPSFVLYAPVYPHFDLYPAVAGTVAPTKPQQSLPASFTVGAYPFFQLYAPVYPYFDLYPGAAGQAASVKVAQRLPSIPVVHSSVAAYPSFQIYAPVYPLFDLYPAVAGRVASSKAPTNAPRAPASPTSGYPCFQLYKPVYPYFDLYPAVAGVVASSKAVTKASLSPVSPASGYPFFQLYKPVYPYFDLYPAVALEIKETSSRAAQSKIVAQPWSHSWPYRKAGVSLKTVATTVSALKAATRAREEKIASVRPWNHSWPYRKAGPSLRTVAKTVSAFQAPIRAKEMHVHAQPWSHSWPYRKTGISLKTVAKTVSAFTPSARVSAQPVSPWNHSWPYRRAGPTVATVAKSIAAFKAPLRSSRRNEGPISLSTGIGYPSLIIYPSVYPHNLKELYPGPAVELLPLKAIRATKTEDPLAILAEYPSLRIYRPVYPHNLKSIYPAIQPRAPQALKPVLCKVDYNVYPVIRIYSLVHSHIPKTMGATPCAASRAYPPFMDTTITNSYPAVIVYPAQYPFFDLYPAPAASRMAEVSRSGRAANAVSTKLVAHYPYFDLYPPVYPHFSLWPSTSHLAVKQPVRSGQHVPSPQHTGRAPKTHSSRLTHSELHAMVMMEQNMMKPMLPAVTPVRKPSLSRVSPSVSPLKRTGSVRFEQSDSPRRYRVPLASRTSALPPRRSPVEPQEQLPPIPTSSLSRSSTLPMRRPQASTGPNPTARQSMYNPETMRTRGLRHNTMSVINLDKSISPIARRLTVWENVASGQSTTPSGTPPPPPSIKQAARKRDSLVIQRIKAFDSQHFVPS